MARSAAAPWPTGSSSSSTPRRPPAPDSFPARVDRTAVAEVELAASPWGTAILRAVCISLAVREPGSDKFRSRYNLGKGRVVLLRFAESSATVLLGRGMASPQGFACVDG